MEELSNSSNPIVYLDIGIDALKTGRVVIELFKDKIPRTAENFRQLCTGEAGIGKNGRQPLHYKGSIFHKLVSHCMVIGGDIVNCDGTSGESIYGESFQEENPKIPIRERIVFMVLTGLNIQHSQFAIAISDCWHLDDTPHIAFGKVVKGFGLIKELSEITTENDKPLKKISIIDCGELTDNIWGLEENDGDDVYTPYPEDMSQVLMNYLQLELSYKYAIVIVNKIKTVGNSYFKNKQYDIAKQKYRKALRYYEWMMNMKDVPKDNKNLKELKTFILLNLAAVELKLHEYKNAINLCNQVSSRDPDNTKAIFRRGQAYLGLHLHKSALEELNKINDKNPNDASVLKEIRRVKMLLEPELEEEKRTCKRMFHFSN